MRMGPARLILAKVPMTAASARSETALAGCFLLPLVKRSSTPMASIVLRYCGQFPDDFTLVVFDERK